MGERPFVEYVVYVLRVRNGAKIAFGPHDRVLYMRSEDDLSLGGEWHTFAVLRAPAVTERESNDG